MKRTVLSAALLVVAAPCMAQLVPESGKIVIEGTIYEGPQVELWVTDLTLEVETPDGVTVLVSFPEQKETTLGEHTKASRELADAVYSCFEKGPRGVERTGSIWDSIQVVVDRYDYLISVRPIEDSESYLVQWDGDEVKVVWQCPHTYVTPERRESLLKATRSVADRMAGIRKQLDFFCDGILRQLDSENLVIVWPANHGPISQVFDSRTHDLDDVESEVRRLAAGSSEEAVYLNRRAAEAVGGE